MHLDLKFATRSLRKSPGFTLTTVLTLALGIGVTTAIFSVLYAVLLKPFAYPEADRLISIWQKSPQMTMSISWPTVQDLMKEQQTFTALAARRNNHFNISGTDQLPENISGAYVSASLFDVAGLKPIAGRYFTANEDKPGEAPVIVISETLWDRRFDRDPNLVGQEIRVDGKFYTVLGVAPKGLDLPRAISEVWVPISPYAATQGGWQTRGNKPGIEAIGRMKSSITIEQVRADMDRIYTGVHQNYPKELSEISAVIRPYSENQIGRFRTGLWSLLAATGFVLLIACANVASLFITRGIRQQRDYAVRSSLGASRVQMIRQILCESIMVSLVGGALGILIAWWFLDTIQYFVPSDSARFQDIALNGWVLGFSISVAVISGILAGLWPALKLSTTDMRSTLNEGSRGSSAGHGVRRALIAGQVALTLVLLSTCGLILRSFEQMQSAPLGFDPSSTLKFSVSLPSTYSKNDAPDADPAKASDPARIFYNSLINLIRPLPGVTNVAVGAARPLDANWQAGFAVEGVHELGKPNPPFAEMNLVSDDYFNTLSVPQLQGRMFNAHDTNGPKVAIIDQSFADKWWPGQAPLGKRVYWGFSKQKEDNWFTVVGVVPTLKTHGYDSTIKLPQAYLSMHQFVFFHKSVLVRTQGHPQLLEREIRELVSKLDPNIAIHSVSTMQEQVESTYVNTTMQSFLLNIFASLALLLALTGLYSVVAYGVSQRQREIGVRMALGAQAGHIIRLMLRQGMVPLLVGIAIGIVGSFAAGQAIRSQLYEVSPTDPLILIATPLLLAAAAIIACYIPSRRASKVDPSVSLRAE